MNDKKVLGFVTAMTVVGGGVSIQNAALAAPGAGAEGAPQAMTAVAPEIESLNIDVLDVSDILSMTGTDAISVLPWSQRQDRSIGTNSCPLKNKRD